MPKFLQSLPPNQRRLALAAAVGGVLALFVVIKRRGTGGTDGGSGTTTTPSPAADSGGAAAGMGGMGPSTFADNGAAAGQLSTTISDQTGALQALTDAFYGWMDNGSNAAAAGEKAARPFEPVVDTPSQPAVTLTPATSPPGQLATVGGAITNQVGGSAPTLSGVAGRPGVFHNADRNLDYIVQNGVRRYETALGKGDWFKGAQAKIVKH